jgi:multidrug efflux pump subunit AcrA (membrane-fusion protein)
MENNYSFWRKSYKLFSIMLLLIAISVGCGKKESDSSDSDTSHVSATVAVEATTVITGNVPEQLVVTGHTEATRQEKLVAPIAGRLLTLNGLEGDVVNAGELIATIQSKEAQSSQEGAQVMLAEAKTPAERAQAKRMIALARKDQNGMQVRSTISGLIATRSANSGEFVAENQELLSIIAEGDIVFVADVPLFDMPHVRIGEPATVSLPTLGVYASPIEARVFAIKPQADSSSQAAQVVFQFRNLSPSLARALRTGITGTSTITFDVMHHVMLVPKSAILRNDETNVRTVVTFGPDSISKSIEVQTGPEIDSLVSVESNTLKPGMNVITVGNYALTDSTRITLVRSTVAPKKGNSE